MLRGKQQLIFCLFDWRRARARAARESMSLIVCFDFPRIGADNRACLLRNHSIEASRKLTSRQPPPFHRQQQTQPDGPLTVFVPSNEALRKIPDEELEVIKNNSTALRG